MSNSMRKQELEESLHHSLKSISELNDCNEVLQQANEFDRERNTHNCQILQILYVNEVNRLKVDNTNLTSQITKLCIKTKSDGIEALLRADMMAEPSTPCPEFSLCESAPVMGRDY
ncbi:12306_t:CDS:2 [Acaulospora morrowiae]|uniref:12306_t:CDS:1 n=1 Tax=Acaulospora morrowiae TaxID=94023 RepID=A0A9N8V7B6_9GLOM|nr:12306_t:CDS:2 [Acaulospora morrowiae]